MKLKPTTRQFLLSAGFVVAFMIVLLGRYMWQFMRATSRGDSKSDLEVVLIDGVFFGGILVLGIAIAWVRLLQQRKERARRAPPLSLD